MTSREWVINNLDIEEDCFGKNIVWNDETSTSVEKFINMFGDIVQSAIDNGNDIRQAIRNNDNGKGFKSLV